MNKKSSMKAILIRVTLERTHPLLFISGFKNFIPILAILYNYFNKLRRNQLKDMTLNLDLMHPFCFTQAWPNGAG